MTLRDRTGAVTTVQAGKEVILTASAVMTPKLMMLSGIGPKAELERHGIATKVELPGTAPNLALVLSACMGGTERLYGGTE